MEQQGAFVRFMSRNKKKIVLFFKSRHLNFRKKTASFIDFPLSSTFFMSY